MAAQISRDLEGKNPLFLAVLNGSFVFAADLFRRITIPAEISFIKFASYEGTTSTGVVKEVIGLSENLAGRTVVIVEDIIDSGRTLSHLSRYLKLKGAKSVRTCTLLDKPDRRVVDVDVEYTGFRIPDEFVVGYGLDVNEKYRNLPYVGILKPEVYTK